MLIELGKEAGLSQKLSFTATLGTGSSALNMILPLSQVLLLFAYLCFLTPLLNELFSVIPLAESGLAKYCYLCCSKLFCKAVL